MSMSTTDGYLVVIEQAADGSYSAYLPDLLGCVACGETAEEARRLIGEAVVLHVTSLRRHGEPVPPPRSTATIVRAA